MRYNIKMKTLSSHLYTLFLAVWVGGIFLFTFIVTPVIFRSYGRDMAGEIVGRLFPSYFLFSIGISAFSLIIFLLVFQDRTVLFYRLSLALLTIALAISLYVNFSLHPKIISVKKEIASFETTPPEDALRKRFRALHGQSAVLNLLMFADGVALLIISSWLRK